MGFNAGLEDQEGVKIAKSEKSTNTKLPEVGDHAARLAGIIHLGVCPKKKFGTQEYINVPIAVAVFELQEESDLADDGETKLIALKDFIIKDGGGKSDMDKIIAFGKKDAGGFTELIDSVYTINITHSTCGKYANIKQFNEGGIGSYPEKFWDMTGKTQHPIGHIKYTELTKEAVEALHSWNHIADLLVKGQSYSGSKAEEIITAIRSEEGREDFGKKIEKDKKDVKKPTEESKPVDAPTPLSDSDEDSTPSDY